MGTSSTGRLAARCEKTKAFPRPALIAAAARSATDNGGKLSDLHREMPHSDLAIPSGTPNNPEKKRKRERSASALKADKSKP